MENIKIGVLGVGAISGIYLQNLTRPLEHYSTTKAELMAGKNV